MLQAAALNGLSGPQIQPWHLKASFRVLYKQGQVSDVGTYEEFWVSGTKYKRTYSSNVFSQTEYGTESFPLRTRIPRAAPYPLGRLRNLIVNPMPNERTIDQRGVDTGQQEIDGVTLDCLELKAWHMGDMGVAPEVFCLDSANVLIESLSGPQGENRISYRNPATFQGRNVARDIEVIDGGAVTLSVHVEDLELLDPVDDAIFQPSADAQPVQPVPIRMVGVKGAPQSSGEANPGGGTSISAGVAHSLLLTNVMPVYPPVARAARVSGTVILQAKISKEGTVTDLRAISGPPLLLKAAMDAVQQWTYRPYLLNGEPVDVMTTVNVVFTLGNQAEAKPDQPQQ